MPSERIAQFNANIGRALDLVGLGQAIGGMTQGRVDASDIYRAALVQSIAAADAYFHGVVLDRAVALLMGSTSMNVTQSRVGLPFDAVYDLLVAPTPLDRELVARSRIASRLALETFQQPDDVAKALAMVGVPRVWSRCFSNAEAAKTDLRVIVSRRNNIVHGCDSDPLQPGIALALTSDDVMAAVRVVQSTIASIDTIC